MTLTLHPPPIDPDQLYTFGEAAKLLPRIPRMSDAVSTRKLWRLCREGHIRVVKVSGVPKKFRRQILGSDILRMWEEETLGEELSQTREQRSRRNDRVMRELNSKHYQNDPLGS